jgi:hypothetical protein
LLPYSSKKQKEPEQFPVPALFFSQGTQASKLLHNLRDGVAPVSETALQDPVAVGLPPGKYRVSARANGYGSVTVPVIIEPQQSTILHLEGGGSWPNEPAFNQTNTVRLPDGQIIGWKAASNF